MFWLWTISGKLGQAAPYYSQLSSRLRVIPEGWHCCGPHQDLQAVSDYGYICHVDGFGDYEYL